MKTFLLAATLLSAAPLRAAVVAADAPAADWRKTDLPDAMKAALRGEGLRLEDDGRVLDSRTHAALTPDQLAAVLARIDLGTQRLALERLGLLLAKEPFTPADRAEAESLKGDLPAEVAKALDARASAAELRTLSGAGIARIAAYFDASRSMDDRRAAALPVRAGDPGPRVPLPYFDAAERRLGDALRASAVKRLSADSVGRQTLGRLSGIDGKPDLPPVLVEDASDPAQYDYRRRALVLDRAAVLASVAGDAPAKDRAALVKSLESRDALIAYLNAHPQAVASFTAQNDALLVHELTHAWQDRRDPVMQEMARGNLPMALLVDDEVEAWTQKNLYIASRLKHDPSAPVDAQELADYRSMVNSRPAWERDLRDRYRTAAINAMDPDTLAAVQRRRVEAVRARATTTRDEQTAKALDLAAMTRAEREFSASTAAAGARSAALAAAADAAAASSAGPLAEHYVALALAAPNPVEFSVLIQTADDYAMRSGDAKLLAKVRSLKGRPR
jgi:hypothetical protein